MKSRSVRKTLTYIAATALVVDAALRLFNSSKYQAGIGAVQLALMVVLLLLDRIVDLEERKW